MDLAPVFTSRDTLGCMSRLFSVLMVSLALACCQSMPPSRAGVPQGFEVTPWLLLTPTGSSSAVPVMEKDGLVLFLTAAHCVTAGEPVELDLLGIRTTAAVVEIHPTLDLAALVARPEVLPVLPELRLVPLRYAERLFSAGYPMGEGPFINEGRAGGEGRSSALTVPGMSGGPVFDTDGYLVGIIVSVIAWRQGPFEVPMSQLGNYQSLHEAEEWLHGLGLVD